MRKIGNWGKAEMLAGLLHTHLLGACKSSSAAFGLIAEKIAKDHIANQDLHWPPLSDKYRQQKEDHGFSDFILVRTSTYVQSITSWSEDLTGYAGVKRGIYYTDEHGGTDEVCNIAKTHEYGSDIAGRNHNVTIPARPLWKPTLDETMELWMKGHTPVHKFQESIKLV